MTKHMIRAIEMTRFTAALLCVWLLNAPINASTLSPGIIGTVFEDLNQDGQITPGEVLSGIPMQLYRDDGDGIFSPLSDSIVGGPIVTGALGTYAFADLSGNDAFFVHQNATTQYQAGVSSLTRPGDIDLYVDDFSAAATVNANNDLLIDSHSDVHLISLPSVSGTRRVDAELLSGAGDVRVLINPYGLDNRLIYSTSAGVTGRSRLTWDFASGAGSGGSVPNLSPIDLTNNGQLSGVGLRVGVDQSGTSDPLTLRLLGDDAGEFSEAQVAVPTTDGFATDFVFVPFTDFIGPVDPTATFGVEVDFGSGAPSVDASIEVVGILGSKVRDFTASPNVPEPHSSALVATAILVLAIGRPRRRKAR